MVRLPKGFHMENQDNCNQTEVKEYTKLSIRLTIIRSGQLKFVYVGKKHLFKKIG